MPHHDSYGAPTGVPYSEHEWGFEPVTSRTLGENRTNCATVTQSSCMYLDEVDLLAVPFGNVGRVQINAVEFVLLHRRQQRPYEIRL